MSLENVTATWAAAARGDTLQRKAAAVSSAMQARRTDMGTSGDARIATLGVTMDLHHGLLDETSTSSRGSMS
jgi:hypothetical protein